MTLVSPFMPPYSLPCSQAGAEASGSDSLIRSLEFHQSTGAGASRRAGMAALRWRGSAEGAVHDRADGPGAAPTFRAAAQTRIDLGRRARAAGPGREAIAYRAVRDDIARTDD